MITSTILKRRYSDRLVLKLPAACLIGTSTLQSEVILEDISDAGARVQFVNQNDDGNFLNEVVHLVLGRGDNRISFQGHIIWSDTQKGKKHHGVRLLQLTPDEKARLQELLFLESAYVRSSGDLLISNGYVSSKSEKEKIETFFGIEIPDFIRKLIAYEKEAGQLATYSPAIEDALINDSENLLKRLNEFEEAIVDKFFKKAFKQIFRNVIANWAYKSELVRRGYEKPLGYPGDFMMLELIYDHKYLSSDFGRYWDNYFLKDPYSQAVRNRKDMMREILGNFLLHSDISQPRILNIASGSCREIRDLLGFSSASFKSKPIFTCVDQDEQALTFAKKECLKIKERAVFSFSKENVLSYARHPEKHLAILRGQDLVYSIGLADYLPDKILKNLIAFSYLTLNPNGVLIFAHKNCDSHNPLAPKWYCDWEFVPRDEQRFLNLFRSVGIQEEIEVAREETGHIFFTTLRKSSP